MNIFKLLKKSFKVNNKEWSPEAPGKSVKMLSHTQPIPNKEHIRADTQTHEDLHYELGKSKEEKIFLFEYGTLKHFMEPPKTETAWRKAEIYGNLHNLGKYMGATDIGKTKNKVKGEIGEINADELATLDKRESVKSGEYKRIKTTTVHGVPVYVYEYTGGKLKKGAMNKFPFNPEKEKVPELSARLHDWQSGGFSPRKKIPRMEGNARKRALHKLASQTQTKRTPKGNYYLLHRGVSPVEHDLINKLNHIEHDTDHSSWSPHYEIADGFSNKYSSKKRSEVPVSAWIHENDIHTVPSQFGVVGYPDKPGVNKYRQEHEVIVSPHKSLKASPEEVEKAQDATSNMNGRINARADDKTSEHSIKQKMRADYAHKIRDRKVQKSLSNLLAKAEKLQKWIERKNGDMIPELSDEGTPNPKNKNQVAHISKLGEAVKANHPDINDNHANMIARGFQNVKFSNEGKNHLRSLIQHVARDPDNASMKTGTTRPENRTGDFTEIRARHLASALHNRDGTTIEETPGGLKIIADRHGGGNEITTWHWNGKTLKSFRKNPISGEMSQGQGNLEAETKQNDKERHERERRPPKNPNGNGRGGKGFGKSQQVRGERFGTNISKDSGKISKGTGSANECATSSSSQKYGRKENLFTLLRKHEETKKLQRNDPKGVCNSSYGPETKEKNQEKGNEGTSGLPSHLVLRKSWEIKLKGLPGYHKVKDVKDQGPGKQNAYILHDDKIIPHSFIEDLRISEDSKPAKRKKLGKSSAYAPSPWQVRNRRFAIEEAHELQKAAEPKKPNQRIRDIADQYAQSKGYKINHNTPSAKVDPEFSKKIAQAYEDMPDSPNHPAVKRAYNALISETKDQLDHLESNGFKFSKIAPDQKNPYPSSKELFKDINENGHSWYYPTTSGFGHEPAGTGGDNPLLQNIKTKSGKVMQANDAFRIVHDVFGHGKEGNSFGPNGEENAWMHHMQMYSPEAQKALTSETRGQNSWVNFGPHAEHNKKDPANTIFAKQKTGILPDWAHVPLQAPGKTEKSLKKDAGQIKFKNLKHKFTRPEQQVKRIPENHKFSEKQSASVGIPGVSKRVNPDSGEFVYNQNRHILSGKSSKPIDFAVMGEKSDNSTQQHEGFHYLTHHLAEKYGTVNVHNLYSKLLSSVHPGINSIIEGTLQSNKNYNNMKKSPYEKHKLNYLEEKINLLHDFVHGRRGKLLRNWSEKNPSEVRRLGFKNTNHLNNTVKQNWKQLRDTANNTTEEDF